MSRQTFVLLQKKTFRHTIRLFLKSDDNRSKVDQRNIQFTTEHKVSEKERNRNARLIPGEYNTSDEKIIAALYHDSGYGKTFTHVDDPKGERKLESFKVTPLDAERLALRNLFERAGMEFDGEKPIDVLRAEYNFHISAQTGNTIAQGAATSIPHIKTDVQQELMNTVASAHKVYEEKYNEPVPEAFRNDLGFLSALADPNWDAKKYIAEKSKPTPEKETGGAPDNLDELRKAYFAKFNKNVANLKKNDANWIKEQLSKEV